MAKHVTAGGDRLEVEMDGIKDLNRTLAKAGADLDDLKASNLEAASIVEGAARPKMPVRTGRLVGTLRAAATKRVGAIRAGKKAVPYAGVIEFGWPARHLPAHPVIVPAAHATEPRWQAVYTRAIATALNQIRGI